MPHLDPATLGPAAGMLQTWVLPVLLGLGLASATGLRTFLPLLMLAVAARFGLFGVTLNDHLAGWVRSPPSRPWALRRRWSSRATKSRWSITP
jgi:hypothetical protein